MQQVFCRQLSLNPVNWKSSSMSMWQKRHPHVFSPPRSVALDELRYAHQLSLSISVTPSLSRSHTLRYLGAVCFRCWNRLSLCWSAVAEFFPHVSMHFPLFFLISPLKVFCEALPNNIRLIVVAAFGFYRLPTFEKITRVYFIILMLFLL